MNILVNCSSLKIGGGLQVAHSFLNELKEIENEDYFVVVCSTVFIKTLKLNEFPENFTFLEYNIKATILKSLTGYDPFLNKIEKKYKVTKVFTVFGPSYWRPKSYHICGFAKPHYIYKNSPFFSMITFSELLKLKLKEKIQLYSFKKSCDAFVTENRDVSDKLKTILDTEKVFTISNTFNQIFNNENAWDNFNIPPFNGTTLLTISANYKHKNLNIIPDVIDVLRSKYQAFRYRFVLTVNIEDLDNRFINYKDEVLFLGKVNIEKCPKLYSQSDIMFLPTLLECFSASYPEAMKMGIPIITSDLPFSRSICADAASYFDPISPSEIAEKIYLLSNSDTLKNDLIFKGYKRLSAFETPGSRTNKYLQIIHSNETNYPII